MKLPIPVRAPGRAVLGLLLAALLLMAPGCGDSQKPTPAGSEVAKPSRPAPPSSEDEEEDEGYAQYGEAGTLPENFPEELKLPDAKSTMWGAWGGEGQLVAFRSEQDPESVFQHFVDGLPEAGWEVGDATAYDDETEGQSWEISATRASQQLRISISAESGGSNLAIAVKAKP